MYQHQKHSVVFLAYGTGSLPSQFYTILCCSLFLGRSQIRAVLMKKKLYSFHVCLVCFVIITNDFVYDMLFEAYLVIKP